MAVFSACLACVFAWNRQDDRGEVGAVLIDGVKESESEIEELAVNQTANIVNPASGAGQEKTLPKKVFINVPFTTQAPFATWDVYHEDACEEASVIMVKYFLDKKELTKEIAEDEIHRVIKFEMDNYGTYIDTNAEQMIDTASRFYGIKNMKAIYDFKKEDIKKYLAKGKPIIIPVAGRLLFNPNFKAPGPLYHALVMVGYDGDKIITNEPGTRKGKSYEYDIDLLYNAIHDFPGKKEDIEKGRKAMIVLE